jgi:DNA-binding MarR family transcriptional regulator
MEKIQRAFDLIRIKDREMPGQVVSVFLYIASHDGCNKQALEQELGLTTASSSRNTDLLSTGRIGRETSGLGLITKEEDPSNGRRQVLKLTPEGKDLARSIKQTIYD